MLGLTMQSVRLINPSKLELVEEKQVVITFWKQQASAIFR